MTTTRTATTAWKRVVREVRRIGQEESAPCSLCRGARGPIDYRTQGEADRDARISGEWWLVRAYRPLALDVDHVVPALAGGADTLENAMPSHAVCNREAQAKGVPQHRPTAPTTPRPVVGHWQPLDGSDGALPGYDVPGRRTDSHVFVPTSRGVGGGPSRPAASLTLRHTASLRGRTDSKEHR